jgi:hypothetical protein
MIAHFVTAFYCRKIDGILYTNSRDVKGTDGAAGSLGHTRGRICPE